MAGLLGDTAGLLPAFLQRQMARPFVWGEADCALFLADWVLTVTGRDPAAHLRGRYTCESSAAALWGPLGLTGIVRDCAKASGLPRVSASDAKPGAIAVARGTATPAAICVIRTGRGWIARDHRTLVSAAHPRIIAAWAVGDV